MTNLTPIMYCPIFDISLGIEPHSIRKTVPFGDECESSVAGCIMWTILLLTLSNIFMTFA